MSASELQQRRDRTKRWNEDVLTSSGFRRVQNSALFRNAAGIEILSPGVDVNSTGTLWFDVRQANLARMLDHDSAWLLVRFVPSSFVMVPFHEFAALLTDEAEREGSDSTPVYSFLCDIDQAAGTVRVESRTARSGSMVARLLDAGQAGKAVCDAAAGRAGSPS